VDNECLIRLIYEYNPRLSGRTLEVTEFRRDLYLEIKPWLPKKTGNRNRGPAPDREDDAYAPAYGRDRKSFDGKEILYIPAWLALLAET
jgi:hypothetical protein